MMRFHILFRCLLVLWLSSSNYMRRYIIGIADAFILQTNKKSSLGSMRKLALANNPPLPNFCSDCGSSDMVLRVPEGDERIRAVCNSCNKIEYSNPKIVVACVVLTDDDRCLLAKRAIEPRKGTWGIPQGFMEHGETTREAAIREVWEETGAKVQDLKFRAVYNVPGSVQLVYEAYVPGTFVEADIVDSTHESDEIRLFSFDAIPYNDLCFPTVQWALEHCLSIRKDGSSSQPRIQQRTKSFDASKDKWTVIED